jgi:BASS family bile acid:Na+ symporter
MMGKNAGAETIANKLRAISYGTDSMSLVMKVGQPTMKQPVSRWFYGKDQAVFVNGKIVDIRLEERDRRISLRKDKEDKKEDAAAISYLRIGMTDEEARSVAGAPDLLQVGEDWYYTKRHRVELNQGHVEKVSLHIKASLETLDWIRLNFSGGSLLIMNITIAFVMFGVALGLRFSSFKDLSKKPKSLIVGITSQFILIPLLTFILIMIINPTPSVAMGMILVAACPGGNVSNFMSSIAKGNMPLSVTLTANSTIFSVLMTPLNFWLWGKLYFSLYSGTSDLVMWLTIDPFEMLKTVFILLGIPIVLGILFSKQFPKITEKIKGPIKIISIVIFAGYIVVALASNITYFLQYIHLIILIVLVHNGLTFLFGYLYPMALRLPKIDRRTISIETGIQNSGLGLVLIFNPNLFDGLGGMAFIAAWWGIWHIIAGMAVSFYWSRRPLKEV